MATLNATGVLYHDGTLVENSVTATRAIFGYGYTSAVTSWLNLVNNYGDVATSTTGVATSRDALAAASYGGDKAIFGYGRNSLLSVQSVTNKVSNLGVVATETAGVGTARHKLAAASYGVDKAIFGYGTNSAGSTVYSLTNKVSNTGVVATDTTGVGTARQGPAAASYGVDKAIFGYGGNSSSPPSTLNMSNLVSNLGVVATDTAGVGNARMQLAAASYGVDKAIFGYGIGSPAGGAFTATATTNLVSNTGVVAGNTTGVGTSRQLLAAAGYGGDKAIFGYGFTANSAQTNVTNKVSNTGVVATDTTGVGTARQGLAAASYSS